MLAHTVLILTLLVTSSWGDCRGGRWYSHVYQDRSEILEDGEVLSRDTTTYEVYKNENETAVEQISTSGTTFDESENEDAIDRQTYATAVSDYSADDMLENSFDADVGDGFQSFSGLVDDDDYSVEDDDYMNEDAMDDWTKQHYKKIKGLRLLQNATQELVLPQSGKLACWANLCHDIAVTIHRVEIVAPPGVTIQCLSGGVGSYKMAFEITGEPGLSGAMTSKMWGVYARGHRYMWVTSGDWAYECGETMNHC